MVPTSQNRTLARVATCSQEPCAPNWRNYFRTRCLAAQPQNVTGKATITDGRLCTPSTFDPVSFLAMQFAYNEGIVDAAETDQDTTHRCSKRVSSYWNVPPSIL